METISAQEWKMIQEQWQVQMWCKVLEVVEDEKHIIYCALEIPNASYATLPGTPGWELLSEEELSLPDPKEKMKTMIIRSIDYAYQQLGNPQAEMLLLKDGPYGIPVVKATSGARTSEAV